MALLYVALVHYPVVNRRGEIIASAVTNLDLHDIARAARTYGFSAFYVVTPLADQQDLTGRLISHWCDGIGKDLHPDREQALRLLRVVDSIEDARKDIEKMSGRKPTVWATSARTHGGVLAHEDARTRLQESEYPFLLLLGTAWGLADSALEEADEILEAIRGVDGYNHLSVRCAAAILMDRLLFRA